ncbi:adenosylcobinamide-GDP ribazoletransferase [Niveibacterium umoris]|uniref:adenosylcobinamide-GDP ribazoletransferase n=1 Tax=Niveibacterium umoris TaxID=1193620 RepID=UPI001A8C91CB|nr:adenosylcobinamide-GDP ribazoletransferase [Niveibacterium umoris]
MRWNLELFFTALGFFTRIPVPRWVPYSQERLNHAARWFPAVGWIVGAASAAALWLAAQVWSMPIAVLLSMAVSIRLTGCFHEDGLADAADGLGGGWAPEQILAIMKDSRIGTYGATALLLALGTKFAALSHLSPDKAALALLVAHPLSRFCSGTLIRTLDYMRADADAKAKPLAVRMSNGEWLTAAACGIAPLCVLAPRPALAALLAAGATTLWWARYLKRRLGGYTGDCLGAAQQLAELACYLAWTAAWTSI